MSDQSNTEPQNDTGTTEAPDQQVNVNVEQQPEAQEPAGGDGESTDKED
jgi:hypothetical protein